MLYYNGEEPGEKKAELAYANSTSAFLFLYVPLVDFSKSPNFFYFILCILPIDFFYFWRYNKYVN